MSKEERKIKRKKRKRVIRIIFWLVVLGIVFSFGKRIRAEYSFSQQLELGNKYLAELNYEEAIASFTKAINIAPKSEKTSKEMQDVYSKLSVVYTKQGDTQLAEETSDKAAEILKQITALKSTDENEIKQLFGIAGNGKIEQFVDVVTGTINKFFDYIFEVLRENGLLSE